MDSRDDYLLADPELAAAARDGFEDNPIGKAYALGYAAGEKSQQPALERLAARGTAAGALDALSEWIASRFPEITVEGIRAEILRRISDDDAS